MLFFQLRRIAQKYRTQAQSIQKELDDMKEKEAGQQDFLYLWDVLQVTTSKATEIYFPCNLSIKFWKIGAGAEQQKHTELLQALEQKLREADEKVKQTEEKLKTAESEKDTAMQCVK